MAASSLTASRLRELLHYDPATGVFTWLTNKSHVRAGSVAGCHRRGTGRLQIKVDGAQCYASRLAWLYMTGEWPRFFVDHIDTNAGNNAWGNLRDVPVKINMQNQRKAMRTNVLGVLGVRFHYNRFQATITVDGKNQHLGSFKTLEEARAAYIEAKRKIHVGCTI